MSYYRTPEHRRLRSEMIRRWRPWEKSTGPTTPEGKARSSRNRWRGGQREQFRALMRELRGTLDEQAGVRQHFQEWLNIIQARAAPYQGEIG